MSERMSKLLKLHEADPRDAFCAYGIALEHAKAGSPDQALAWLDKTLAIDRHYCYAYFQKGKLLAQKGDRESARAALREGLRMAEEAGDSHAQAELSALLETL